MNKKLIAGIVIGVIVVFLVGWGFGSISDNPSGALGAVTGGVTHTVSRFDALGGFSVNGTTVIDSNGNLIGNILQNASTTDISYGITGVSTFVQGIAGWQPYSTSTINPTLTAATTLTAAQECASTEYLIPASVTSSFSITTAPATSTYALCPLNPGAYGMRLVTNLSTSSITLIAGAGVTLQNQTIGMGTTTISGTANVLSPTSTAELWWTVISSSSIQIQLSQAH